MVLARSKSRAILSASAGWKSPAAGNLSATLTVAKQRWTTAGDAVIKGHDGTWYLAIRTRKLARAEDFIVSLGGEKGGEIAAEVTEKDLYDTTGKGRLLYEKIIFGCVGGVFHAADGVRSARVKACIASENGDSVARLRFVHWRTAADRRRQAAGAATPQHPWLPVRVETGSTAPQPRALPYSGETRPRFDSSPFPYLAL